MDVLTDSSLTLIVKTSETANADVGENRGENCALFSHICNSKHYKSKIIFIKHNFLLNGKCT